jgi:hypothetical protein
LFNGYYGVLVGEDEKVLEMDGGDSCTMWLYLTPLNQTSGYSGKFCHNEKP